MPHLLTTPAAPALLAAFCGTLLAALGVALRQQPLVTRPLNERQRLIIGQSSGLLIALLCFGAALSGGIIWVGLGLAAYLALGLKWARQPQRDQQRLSQELRRLTPGLIGFIRVALGSFEAPSLLLRRYCAQATPRQAPMRSLVAEALALSEEQRMRPFAALAEVARRSNCRELIDATAALAQAEAEGTPVEMVLAAQQQTLEALLQGEFRRLIRRRTVYLLLLTAISLVVGILLNLLFVMVVGSEVFAVF
ncbi:MAG TPA: hypothetical protein DEF43_08285 [Chloroflexus aurantiacus]|jgi:hypothetical protein|uniref:Type II secretion system protein n=1 Tax=Chloroflexus aurantiacus (strain ATCC 29366 / DSM 635 / J-10-fl) TaxID=324602 RepID=A9WH42_CHLAA|nr:MULTISPECIES: hypothetical protein [Chloroflexus]ABY34137.1 conserved hypothetical protein [Chloroflexus aurantiacus J-10-fl]RMG53732.1 MAG: hypothetical protein D6716_00215 [Chloroflexota bacterium]GIV93596.1 MAG: hypothetical protein KatS3mg056_2305 [Chloroflexus sp.]HBW67144.1 hypothetical protein [Chloroflexus aurantiacus]